MKKTSIKTAILFSTLVFGTVQANSLVHQNETFSVVAHADSDTSTTNINQIKDSTIKNILLASVNNQENKGYQNASEITNDDLQNLTSINYTGNGSDKVLSLDNFNIDILPNIKSINIKNVDMTSLQDLRPFVQWDNLSSVSLSNDKISSEQLNTLGKWSAEDLTNLDLSNNNISNLSFLKNISIPNIQSIDVNHNQIADFTPVVSQDWTKLTDLNVGFNNIEDISPIATVNWPSLQNLNVESNKISDISVISTANWPNLQSLDADNNNISNINAFADTNWTNLQTISASGNKIQNVNALGGKSSKFKNLDIFKVNNNAINDISWMSGYKFNYQSTANNQNVTDTQVITKPENGQSVLIPVTIKDVTLGNGVNWTYVASDDNAGTNLEASNISDPNATIIGNDGQPFKLVQSSQTVSNSYSNGIKGINLKYDGSNTSTVSFNFASNFGINQNTYFTGLYTLKVNWATANTQNKNVKVTVNYVDQNGNPISKPETKTVAFTETGKKVDATGEQIWNNDWKATGDTNYSFSSPSVDGYKLADESQKTINGNVNSDSGDINETVVYKAIQSESNSDSNSHSTASSSSSAQSSASSSVTQSSSAQSSASSSVAQSSSAQSSASSSVAQSSSAQSSASSSVAQSSSAQSSVAGSHSNNAGNPTSKKSSTNTTPNNKSSSNHGNNAGNQNRTVTIKHVDPAVPGNNNKASHHDAESKNKLPQTGDKTEQNVLISLGAVAIATALGLAAFTLRRKNK
ncbi:MucBP domain-containing protein [Apilactobacillus kunkeei]|uniref:mucin-binding protein n=1 Tax=Apilactobacillus kunkeei TaxID=148814 RepID=UPI00200A01D5|nr:LPXTG cell wall anchor domain-containing protein [Apilactobacillus kunkeei]MCK8635689.1 MucBP domain-containing protein [Apilactobacillus kunkeei]